MTGPGPTPALLLPDSEKVELSAEYSCTAWEPVPLLTPAPAESNGTYTVEHSGYSLQTDQLIILFPLPAP